MEKSVISKLIEPFFRTVPLFYDAGGACYNSKYNDVCDLLKAKENYKK
jgi:hypothetical protein